MIFASWNVRGFNGPLTQNKVVTMCRQHNLSIFGMLETKVPVDRLGGIMYRKFIDWKYHSNHEVVQGGRIVILWNPQQVECEPMETHAQAIHYKVINKINAQTFFCSFVYGASNPTDREELWSSLISSGVNHAQPWMLLGDFNSVLSIDERQGGVKFHAHDMEKFSACATSIGMVDAPSIGNLFTWTNGTL